MAKGNSKARKHSNIGSSSVATARGVNPLTKLLLFVSAGGRCEFDGCNDYLLEHPLTLTAGNFAQVAHVVAFKVDGPRGASERPIDINNIANLMLLCPRCHKLIDDDAATFPVSVLKKYKEGHEKRIRHVTGLGPDRKTTIVQLKCRIAGHTVAIPAAQVTSAVAPRYPTDTKGEIIDLTDFETEGPEFIELAAKEIQKRCERLYAPGMDVHATRHISLFALAPIPLLIFLGRQLSNKVPVDVYQRHRDSEDWVWKDTGTPVQYQIEKLSEGEDRTKVALIISLSGQIHRNLLPSHIDVQYSVYEISLRGVEPSPAFLRLRDDLEQFKGFYQGALRSILAAHGPLEEMHLFPAVPAPIAVHCGRELLPKVDPTLLVYDYDKRNGGFQLAIKVNSI